jgi:hypothetical protein
MVYWRPDPCNQGEDDMGLDSLLHIDFSLMNLPMDDGDAMAILYKHGSFGFLKRRDVTRLVRNYIDHPIEGRANTISVSHTVAFEQAPKEFSPITFVRWCFLQLGIRLPGTAQGIRKGMRAVQFGELRSGDLLIFTPPEGIQHFGIVTKEGTVVYAACKEGHVIERKRDDLASCAFEGMRRLLPEHTRWTTLFLPHTKCERNAEAIKRFILAHAPLRESA